MTRKEFFRRCFRSKLLIIGGLLAILILLLALLAPVIIPHDAELSNFPKKLQRPDMNAGWSGYPLGADSMGRDLLSRLLMGARYSLGLSILSVALSALVGTILGLMAGYFGSWFNTIIMRFADIQLSIPQILLAIAIVAVLGPSLINLLIVLVLTSWVQYARLIQSSVLVIRENDFVAAAKMIGTPVHRIIVSEILPNTLSSLFIMISQQIGQMILVETSLSFLGLGVQAPKPSWGIMISEGRNYVGQYPFVVMAPGLALMITVLAFSFLGDGIRDVLDPKMRDV